MPRFYFHVHEPNGSIADEDGRELLSLDQARTEAIKGVRSVLAADVAAGRLDLRGRIEVADGDGKILIIIPFREIIAVQPEL